MKKLPHLILGLSLLFSIGNLCGQTNRAEDLEILFPSLPSELQNNIVVLVGGLMEDPENPQPCPPVYTNLLSNTNLFSPAEAKRIKEVILKYKNVTTNTGPSGTVFKGWGKRQIKWNQQLSNTFPIAFFTYTNSFDREEIASPSGDGEVVARFRTPTEDGYDVKVYHGMLTEFEEYKKGVLDGLYIFPNNPTQPNNDFNKCYVYLRFANGKAVGKYIVWDDEGEISFEMEFKKPFDILKYSSAKFDLSWTETLSNSTNSIQSSDGLNSTRQP